MSVVRGKWIVLEGPDGAGKTTQVELLRRTLNNYGVNVVTVREPGGTLLGESLRILIKDSHMPMTPTAQLFALTSARAQVLHAVVEPALAEGKWVVMDRHTPSTIVYQNTIPWRKIFDLQDMFDFLLPDLYLFLVAPYAKLATRLPKVTQDRFDIDEEASKRGERYYDISYLFDAEMIEAGNSEQIVQTDINYIVFTIFNKEINAMAKS